MSTYMNDQNRIRSLMAKTLMFLKINKSSKLIALGMSYIGKTHHFDTEKKVFGHDIKTMILQ